MILWNLFGSKNNLDGIYVKLIITGTAIANGIGRPFWGYFFDKKGFKLPLITVQIVSIVFTSTIYFTVNVPVLYTLICCFNLAMFGCHFAILPAVCSEIFGKKYNYY